MLRFFQRGCFSFLNNIFGSSKLNRSFKLKIFQKRRRAVVTWNDKCTCQVPPELIMGEYMMAHQARVWLCQRKNTISIKFQMKIFVKRIILLSTKKRWTCFVVNMILWSCCIYLKKHVYAEIKLFYVKFHKLFSIAPFLNPFNSTFQYSIPQTTYNLHVLTSYLSYFHQPDQ